MKTIQDLENKLAQPSADLIRDIAAIDGDIMLLGVGGKMGPSLARLAMNAIKEAGVQKKVIGASRFSSGDVKQELEAAGVETISVDLLDDAQLQSLPDVKNVIYMAGNKFGTTGNEHFTWAMNAYLPGRVAEKYKDSRIVVFSTGNVYPMTPIAYGGVSEEDPTGSNGEYGQSCLGRERVFEYFSHKHGTPLVIYRLNYAIDMRYGVLLEMAKQVKAGKPIDVTMGSLNCIWQGDANEIAIRALNVCSNPPKVLNVSGPETISLRWLATMFGQRFGVDVSFVGEESPTAYISNSAKAHQLFGYPSVSLLQMIDWTAEWLNAGGHVWNKPTHFQEREGKY
ncbi:NAD-dependent epimerase/dehydratase family protein [Paenibacillus eucommiae]|uniref:Nucleoside-diphosphate-sugar epimerase n=1 Tax=Paenibacillus eucommiae TaxID=1355755 RepID=A0ABS4J4R3_9BACL|nr:NAD(P)-dependent oxidoreductase [Paenibacillus eucommiae]MBP1994824.1 nucleoside-diphosphate-sugar epimerase [Paenibacillus eucommiae]